MYCRVTGWFILLTFGVGHGYLAAQATPLDDLVQEGLTASLSLTAERLAVRRAEAGVREATGRWLPSVTLNARYSERSGNLFDIGELVNPAFRALNQLLGQSAFPTDISLIQPYKQETSVRLAQPLFAPAIVAGSSIARSARDAQAAASAVETRRQAARIRLAYLDVARAARLEELATATVALTEEALRVSQSLEANGAATPDAVLRAQADRSAEQQRLAEARQLRASAGEAFNLLLERPLTADVPLLPDSLLGIGFSVSLDSAVAHGLAVREELTQVSAGIRVARGQERLAGSAFLPALVAAVDYGTQGDRYRFTGEADYLVASLSLQWNLFNGGQDRARKDAARLEADRLRTTRTALERQVALEIRAAWRAAEVSRDAIETSQDRLLSAERSYALVERQYRQGAATQVQLLDARTSFTAARLNQILTRYTFLARAVDLDRSAGLYPVGPLAAGGTP